MVIHLDIAADGDGGTRVAADWEVRSKGFMRLLEPVIKRAFTRQLDPREAQVAKGIVKRVPRTD